MFNDPTLENLDEISKLCEPMVYSLNNHLIAYPEKTEITVQDIKEHVHTHGVGSQCNLHQLLRNIRHDNDLEELHHPISVHDYFEIQVEDAFGEKTDNISINFNTETMDGRMFVVKKKYALTDKEMREVISSSIRNKVSAATRKPKLFQKKLLNEVAEVFDIKGVSSARGAQEKRRLFLDAIQEQMDSHKINIRDVDLGIRFAGWIKRYITTGNLAAIKNICLLKVMIHDGKPVYSLESEEKL